MPDDTSNDTNSSIPAQLGAGPFNAQDLVEIVGSIIYLGNIYILLTSKNALFRSAFYTLFISTGFCNVFSIIVNVGLRRFICRTCPIPTELIPVAKLFPQLAISTGMGYIIGNFLLTLNRYTAMKYPARHKKMWTRNVIVISIFLHAVFPEIYYMFMYFDGYKITYIDDESVLLGSSLGTFFLVTRLSAGILAFGYLLVATSLNLIIIDALTKYKKRNGVNIQSSEKGILFYTFWTFLMSSISCVRQILLIYANFIEDRALDQKIRYYTPWNIDFQSISPPFLMLAFSKESRTEVLNRLGLSDIQICCDKSPINHNGSTVIALRNPPLFALNPPKNDVRIAKP